MWRNHGICGATPNSCGAICGTRRMSNFLLRTPCAPLRAGHRTLPPINRRPWPKRGSGIRQERRSAPRGNSRRRPGDGVGGVGKSARSRGASPSLLARGPLGAHTIERPSPLLPLWDRPCRFQSGDRVPAGLPEGARVPSRRRFPWGSRETRDAAGSPAADRGPGCNRFAGGGMGPGSSKVSAGDDLDPDHSRLAGGGTGPGQQRSFHTAGRLAASARWRGRRETEELAG